MIQTKPFILYLDYSNQPINLLFISDVHHAQAASDEDLLEEDLSYKLKGEKRLFIGIGDEVDCIARTDKRHHFEDLKPKFQTIKEYHRLIDAEIEDYGYILKSHTKPEEWLGHCSGNHPEVLTSLGIDPIQSLCKDLKHQYLGYSAFIPLHIMDKTRNVGVHCMIMVHHGFGGTNARKEGSSINAYIDHAMRFEGWDIAAYGHRHDRWSKLVPRIKPQGGGHLNKEPWVRAIDRCVLQSGTYLRTLSHSEYPTYSEKAGYTPKPLGCVKLKIGIERIRNNGKDNVQLKFINSNI